MRRIAGIGMALAFIAGMVGGEPLPPLPAWSQSDFEKLKKGEIVPGEGFFRIPEGDGSAVLPPLPEEELPQPPPDEGPLNEFPTEIGEEFLARYNDDPRSGTEGVPRFLVDPQQLLSAQELRDRESFLQYHAGESTIDIFVYLFDDRQELPAGFSIRTVYENHFATGGASAVVFYHLGMPERAQLIMSNEVRAVASEEEQTRALRAAVQEAFEKSDPAYQLDNFLVELSIRLYWIEREMAGLAAGASAGAPPSGPVLASAARVSGQRDQTWDLISRMIILVVLFIVIVLLLWLGVFLADRRVRHVFPEVECGPLLGAPHAAGVGAVLSFSSAQIPPSQQRDDVPDYLQRL